MESYLHIQKFSAQSRWKSSVMLLLCLAVFYLISSSPCASAPSWYSTGSRSARNKLLLISFDGFRWDYDRDVDTPNLDKMAQDGVKAIYVTPPFLTITSPAHFTLLTGNLKKSPTINPVNSIQYLLQTFLSTDNFFGPQLSRQAF